MKQAIINYAASLGIEKCGFTHYEDKGAVVCLFPYFNGYSDGNLSLYTRSKDYHIIIRDKLTDLSEFIRLLSPDVQCSAFADIGPGVDRSLAYRAGLGFYGKNTMLINPDLGSYFFIGYILCNLRFEVDSPLSQSCKGCNRCIRECAGGALGENFDISRCASHISQKKGELSAQEQSILCKSGLVFGCDICQKVCPHNNITPRPMKEFTEDLIHSLTLKDLENLSNREFMRKYKNRAFSWRGRNVILRNLKLGL